MITEGSRVQYAGDDPYNEPGAQGTVLVVSGSAAHVQWQTGPKAGQVELTPGHELLAARRTPAQPHSLAASFDNSLDMLSTPTLQVRATYDEAGEDGLLSALDEAGKISVLAEYAEQAVQTVAAHIRADHDFGEVLSQLDPDEGASLVNRVASLVLMDRISEGD